MQKYHKTGHGDIGRVLGDVPDAVGGFRHGAVELLHLLREASMLATLGDPLDGLVSHRCSLQYR